ncbi:MAG TPA: galactose oxidase-like domain-containing protein, partial [Myxococcales bacterium]|nr:galactose oxidase-like domain-containing protein [Myxococcales bacterium]
VIGALSSSVLGYGTSFTVSYTSASPISSAVLMRPGSTTHADDMEQRLVGLCGPSPQPPCSGAGTLTLATPASGNIAPPGYYMLFLLDSAGVPSKAAFLQLTPYASAPPSGSIDSPAGDVTIQAGASVAFSTSATAAAYSWVFPGGTPANSTARTPGSVTFGSAGIFTASLTLIDSSGNSDPSPPTRTITVLSQTADFSIAVSPSAVTVAPGQSASFTVSVTPQSGFANTVSLSVGSESGFPAGIASGGFSPASIAGSGTSTLTMNTTSSTSPYALSLTITGTSGTTSHQASTTLLVNLAAPSSLSAVPGDGQVALSWSSSAAAAGYSVQRSLLSGGPYVPVSCPASTSYTDTGLVNGTQYAYVVTATFVSGPNAGGASAPSPEALATPRAAIPATPGGLAAAPCNGSVALSWNASSGAASYGVKRATASGGPYAVIGTPTSTSFTDGAVTNGTTYFYVVSAVNASGESPNSAQASATPPGPIPAAPTALSTALLKQKGGSVRLAWTQSASSGVTQNGIYRRTSAGSYGAALATVPATSTYTDARPASGNYCYVVTALSCSGEGARSNESCIAVR